MSRGVRDVGGSAEERRSLSQLLAASFAGYPLTEWVVGDRPDAAPRRERYFGILLDEGFRNGRVLCDAGGHGAAVWFPPGRWAVGASTLLDNAAEAGESLTVIGQSGAVLGRLEAPIASGFVGVVSSEPIASLYFDEHPGGDDIAIRELVFERNLADENGDLVADCDVVPTVQFTTNLTTWSNTAGTAYTLTTTAANVALANEVPSPPAPNVQLCGTSGNYQVPCTLTWEAANTGACRDFALGVQQGITFDDNELSYPNSLSIGDVDDGENDDFVVTFGGGPPTHAFGFTLLNSGATVGEEIRVYDTDDALIGRQTLVPANVDSVFIGITSNQPIGRVEFDEDAGGDDIAIRDLRMDCDGLP